jgi:hypothetical protein
MSKAIPSRSDPNKWGCSVCDYGHDVGKSRNGVYKHFKKKHQNLTNSTLSETGSQYNDSENENLHKIEETDKTDDFVKNSDESPDEISQNPEESGWGSIEWDEDENAEPPKTKTIPQGLKGMKSGFDPKTQGHLVRMGFKALDRAVTHYGRGVMSDPSYALERSEDDYDALESATVDMMIHYGINVPVNPLVLWSMTVGSAYVPPMMHIRRNADPNRPKRSLLRGLLGRFRRKRSKGTAPSTIVHTEQRSESNGPNP